MHSSVTGTRREFISMLALIALIRPSLSGSAAFAVSSMRLENFRSLVLCEDAVNGLASVADSDAYIKRIAAISNIAAQEDGKLRDALDQSLKIVNGEAQVPTAKLLSGLINRFRKPPLLPALDVTGASVTSDFEGLVSSSGSLAVLVSSIAVRNSNATGEIAEYTKRLPLPSNRDKVLRAAISGIWGASENLPLADPSVIASLNTVAKLDYSAAVDQIIDRLPTNAKTVANSVLALGFAGVDSRRADIDQILTLGLNAVLGAASQEFQSLASSVRQGEALLHSSITQARIHSVTADMSAVSAIGGFLLGPVFGDQKAAKQFNAGMQVANVAMTAALMFSTGGVGVLAGASGVMSSLGAVQGLFGGASGDANQAMLGQISAQIEALRREMLAHFAIVEELQRRTLNLLEEISQELRRTRVAVIEKIDRVNSSVIQADKNRKNANRYAKVEQFGLLTGQAKGMIAQPLLFSSEAKFNVLNAFLNYSITDSGNPDFIGDGAFPLASSIVKIDRADFAVALLRRCGDVLGFSAPQLNNNPLEWARGLQAYLETHSHMPEVTNPVIGQLAAKSWGIGKALHEGISGLCSSKNAGTANDALARAAARLANELRSRIASSVVAGRAPRLGRLPMPQISAPFRTTYAGEHPKAKFVSEHFTSKTGRKWILSWVETDDLLKKAVDSGAVTLNLTGSGADELRSKQVDRPRPQWFEFWDYRLSAKDGRDLGPIRKLNMHMRWGARGYRPNEVDFTGWDTSMRPDSSVQSFLNVMLDEIVEDDQSAITAWLDNPVSFLNSDAVSNYDEVAAAFVLFSSYVAWFVTDQVDDPWRCGMAARMLRSTEGARTVLKEIVPGLSRKNLWMTAPPSGESKGVFDQCSAALATASSDEEMIPWVRLKVEVDYADLSARIIMNWTARTALEIEKLTKQIPDNRGFGLTERMLGKCGGVLM